MKFLLAVVADPPDRCVLWPHTVSATGYGRVMVDGKIKNAHRIALQLFTAMDGKGLLATHGPCHQRLCMNPIHMSWGTAATNSADRIRDGSVPSPDLCRGSASPQAKIDEATAMKIFRDRRTQHEIARCYGISRSTVAMIKTGARWSWLTSQEGVTASQ